MTCSRMVSFTGLASLFIAATTSGCTSPDTAHQDAPLKTARLIDIVGDTPIDPLPVPDSEVAGALAGDASVQGGAASYRIAIDVPPGRRGMQPRVSLEYSSRAGNGIAGMGWSLTVGSSIYRCPRTIAHDGETRGVDFTGKDRLCLDGQRLIAVSGRYGRAGSEYRTEIDRFARITLHGGSMASTAAYFQVESKEGTIQVYSAVHVPDGAPAPLAWKLRRVVDRQDNSIEYRYDSSSTGHVLTSIHYTGTGATPGDRSVIFTYEQGRPDVSLDYRAGAVEVSPLRLSDIRTYVGSALVRRYELRYRTSEATGRSLLARVRVCARDDCAGTDRTPWTEFSYAEDAMAFADDALPEASGEHRRVILVGDYDGDGTRDRMTLEYPEPWGGTPSRRLLHLSSRTAAIDLSHEPWLDVFDASVDGYPSNRDTDIDRDGVADLVGRVQGHLAFASWRPDGMVTMTSDLALPSSVILLDLVDMDADGDSDVLVLSGGVIRMRENCTERGSATIRFCASTPVTTLDHEEVVRLADIDGNGLPDLVIDWNGFGNPVPTRIVFTRASGGALSFASATVDALGGPGGSFREYGTIGFFDANGDGLLDIYHVPIGLWLNTGGRFVAPAESPGGIAMHHRLQDAVLVVDIDTDGRDELLVPATLVHEWCYLLAHRIEPTELCGTDFLLNNSPVEIDRSLYRWDVVRVRFDERGAPRFEQIASPITAPVRGSHINDFTGDGLPDLMYRIADGYSDTPSGPQPLGYYSPALAKGVRVVRNLGAATPASATSQVPDLLDTVRDGMGREHTWVYAPLSSSSVSGCTAEPLYRIDHDAAAPHHYHFASSMPVVARLLEPSGVGSQNSTCYRYEDAMYSDEGRGFLGFRAITAEQVHTEDPENNLRTTTRYHDAFPLTGRIASVEVHVSGDDETSTPLRASETTWDARCSGGVCFVYATVHTERVHELATRALLSTTTTATTYEPDDLRHGNPSAIEVTIDDAFMTHVQRTELDCDYGDAAAWWIDKLVRTTVTHEPVVYKQAPQPDAVDNGTSTVVTELRWYGSTGASARLLREEIVQPGDPAQEHRTRYEYDGFGNVQQQIVRAVGVDGPRITTWSYTPDGYSATRETNPAGHVTTLEHAPETGLLVEETGYGVTTRYAYDGLGRLIRTDRDGAAPMHVRRLRCGSSCPGLARMRVVTVQDGAPTTWEYVDALGRVIQTSTSGFAGSGSTGDIVRLAEYNARGYLVRESRPSTDASSAHFTTYSEFDALGRAGRKDVDQAGLAHPTFTTTYRHEGAITHIELPGALTASRTFDARGLLVGTVDTAGSITSYRHDAQGQVIVIEDSAGNRWTARHDDLGRRVAVSDPDGGAWTFAYNGLGELVRQTDANGRLSSFDYDILGRMRMRVIDGVLAEEWTYDVTRPGTLEREQSSGFARTYTYDDALRPTRITTQVDGLELVQEYAYGAYHGHLEGIRYPGGEIVAFDYDRHGYLIEERDPTRNTVTRTRNPIYRRIHEMTPDGQVAREWFGNRLEARYDHIASTGQLRGVQVRNALGFPRQELSYEYGDPYGNLTQRSNGITGVSEVFTYDALQRLDSATRTWSDGRAPVVIDYEYDALGNLIRKDDFAVSYQYGDAARSNPASAGPHAVATVTRPDGPVVSDFAYDANGNMLAGNGRHVRYNAANKPIEIDENGVTTMFWYGPDQARYKQTRGDETTYYVGKDYEYIIAGGEARERTYIGGYLVIEQSAAGRRVRYLHGDRMGSVDMVTDEHGAVIERHGFDAFGKPLTADWEDAGGLLHSGEYATATTTRGFSAHEHLDAHGLIHMNGRAYDPALGRFLSVDPFIQNPLNSQSLNPYSYVINNPLSGVDPTGYECDPVDGDSAGCVDSDGNINEPATADPGQTNGKQGQGVGSAGSGPAVDRGRPGKPMKDCGGGSCVTLPNTVKRTVVDGEVHYDFGFDDTGSASPDDGKASLGTGRGLISVRLTVDQIKALDGAMIVGMVLSGVAGAARAALGRLYHGIASRTSGTLSSALRRFTSRLRALSRTEQAVSRGGGARTYEILDGVRRSKAAEIAGRTSIEAEIEVAGRTVGRENLPLDVLRSPKEAISTAGSGLQRWLNTLGQTLSGSRPPPIRVTPGARGTRIPDVRIE